MSARKWIAGVGCVVLLVIAAFAYSQNRRQRTADGYEIEAVTAVVDRECGFLSGDLQAVAGDLDEAPNTASTFRLNGRGGLDPEAVEVWSAEYRVCSAARFTSTREALDDAASFARLQDRLLQDRGAELAKTLHDLRERLGALTQRPFRRERLAP